MTIELIIGGARSGKSSYAESQARAYFDAAPDSRRIHYIATAERRDAEMAERIALHRLHRPIHWNTIEQPHRLSILNTIPKPDKTIVIIDCLTLWVSNCLHRQAEVGDLQWDEERNAFLSALITYPGHVLIVTNEVGQGIVPLGEITRNFVDASGWLNQDLARIADRVVLMTAGLPQILKDTSTR